MDWRWVCRRISSSGTTTLWTWNIYNKIHQLLYQLSQSLQLTSYRSHVSISCPKLYHVSQKYYNCTRNGFSCPDTIFHSTWPAINISIQFSLNLNLYCSLIPLGRPYCLEREEWWFHNRNANRILQLRPKSPCRPTTDSKACGKLSCFSDQIWTYFQADRRKSSCPILQIINKIYWIVKC